MQLEDLRRTWQQPPHEPPPAPFDAEKLKALLQYRSTDLLGKLRRSAYFETAGNAVLAVAVPAVWLGLRPTEPIAQAYMGILLMLTLCMLYYFYRKLRMLRELAPVNDVRNHLERLCKGLRAMLRFYYRLTLAIVPMMLVLLLVYTLAFSMGYQVGRDLAEPEGLQLDAVLTRVGFLLAWSTVVQVAALYGTRWYLQRLYGRHLDRLEGLLRDLNAG